MIRNGFLFGLLLLTSLFGKAQDQDYKVHKDLLFAAIGDRLLSLDLYMPANNPNPYVLVWVHGGAWHSASKENPPLDYLPEGFALASVEYRLSTEAVFPAQIQDIKAAIQWLRGHQKEFGYRSDKIIIWGSSAGGHLAALVGTTNGVKEFDPDYGHHNNESSDVQGIIDFFGPTDFTTILSQSTPHGINVRAPAMVLLLGKPQGQDSTEARLASPVFHVDPSDPPIFIAHGNMDNQVPINQSIELLGAYEKNNLPVEFKIVQDEGHGGAKFHDENMKALIMDFISKIIGKPD